MFFWTEEKIELYKRAAEYTRFNDDIGKIVLSNIGEDREIWDIGCGISYLSLYLSRWSKSIDCVDKDKRAIDTLGRLVEEGNYKNINLYNEDFEDYLSFKDKGDCILLSHFLNIEGRLEELLEKSNTLVIIRNSKKREEKGLFRGRKQTIEDVEDIILNYDKNIEYKKIIHRGDFGQPLKSLEEACDYYTSYTNIDISIKEVEKKIRKVDDKTYPYYFPKRKVTGIIIIGGDRYYE